MRVPRYNLREMGLIYAGTSGWAYSSWKPGFYPRDLGPAGFLAHYAGRLNSVEVNFTFRNALTAELLDDWIRATPRDFIFAVKAHQEITHFKRLRGAVRGTRKFLASLRALEKSKKLGPVLFQLPPNFKCDLALLKHFVTRLPQNYRFAFEFRHPSWFNKDVYEMLRGANVALCLAESEKLVTPEVATADFSYLRLRKDHYSAVARAKLAEKIRNLAQRGDVFAYFKHEDKPDGARHAERLLEFVQSISKDAGLKPSATIARRYRSARRAHYASRKTGVIQFRAARFE